MRCAAKVFAAMLLGRSNMGAWSTELNMSEFCCSAGLAFGAAIPVTKSPRLKCSVSAET